MSEFIITKDIEEENDIKHYGVLGMKWGVRRANKKYSTATTKEERAKASKKLSSHMEKASKKLNKLDTKITKKHAKAEKAYNKYTKVAGRSALFRSESTIRNKKRKFKAADARYANSINKANRWYADMEKVFKETPLSTTKQQQAMGKRYADAMADRFSKSGFDRW